MTQDDRGRDPEDPQALEGNGTAEPSQGQGAQAAEVLQLADQILRGLGLNVEATVHHGAETIDVDLTGPDREHLLDRRGEGLNALQYLLNRILYRGQKEKKVHVDCDGFRRTREEEIIEISRRAAEKVRARGEVCLLSPLNPYERRLVHLALRDVADVETKSLGEGFLKRVAIRPAGKGDSGERGPRF